MKMKKLAAVALAVVMSVSMLAGCGSSNDKKSASSYFRFNMELFRPVININQK